MNKRNHNFTNKKIDFLDLSLSGPMHVPKVPFSPWWLLYCERYALSLKKYCHINKKREISTFGALFLICFS